MDELELLKQDWKRQENSLPHVDENEIRKMMHKKSTSIVKWIFVISIVEFLFWISLELIGNYENANQQMQILGIEAFYKVSSVINYVMIFVFISLFFINFRKISANDSIKGLMKNIINTRKTVRFYVWYNIIFFSIVFLFAGFIVLGQVTDGEELIVKLKLAALLIVIFVICVSMIMISCLNS